MSISTTQTPTHVIEQFEKLAADWKAATSIVSSTGAMTSHPSYQAIIALGPPVLPLLLRDMAREGTHWFEALQAISGEDPVRREDWGKISTMKSSWLQWGHARGLI